MKRSVAFAVFAVLALGGCAEAGQPVVAPTKTSVAATKEPVAVKLTEKDARAALETLAQAVVPAQEDYEAAFAAGDFEGLQELIPVLTTRYTEMGDAMVAADWPDDIQSTIDVVVTGIPPMNALYEGLLGVTTQAGVDAYGATLEVPAEVTAALDGLDRIAAYVAG